MNSRPTHGPTRPVSTVDSPLEWIDGQPFFRGLKVDHGAVEVAGRRFQVARLRDAADLLDDPEFAARFVERDIAPYGLEIWPASFLLAQYVLVAGSGAGASAIELGCGVGLVSLAAAARGWDILATDCDPVALQFAKYNAEVNSLRLRGFDVLNWHTPQITERFERIFAADVLYQLVDHEPLLLCVDALLVPGGRAVIADPYRSGAETPPTLAQKAGFRVDVQESSAMGLTGEIRGRLLVMERGSTPA